MDRTTEDIWREFSGPLRGFLIKRIAEPEDVEDVLQDVFVKLHTRIDTLRDGERIAPWLYRVARNTLIDYYRERRPVVGLPDDLAVEDEPEESDAQRHIAASLTSMVDQLPESYRQAVTLADLQAVPQP